MSQIDCNQATTNNKKKYHSPQLKKFGKVSELTLSNTAGDFSLPTDGGSFPGIYSS